ncbi:unnamed protein product, partial [Symbiodinium pilosum]
DSDEIFGGWLNLDSRPQFFHCIPGSHRQRPAHNRRGFCRQKCTLEEMCRVEVSPGHVVIFYQDILHKVCRETIVEDSLRLFIGWRLTQSDLSLQDLASKAKPGVPDTDSIFDTQAVPLLPSGQHPPMYAKNHLLFWREELMAWSRQSVRDGCKELTKCGNCMVLLAPRRFSSLKCMGLPMYEEYSEEEKSIMKPAAAWTLSGRRVRLASVAAALRPSVVDDMSPCWQVPRSAKRRCGDASADAVEQT